jgi:hypothetical protein
MANAELVSRATVWLYAGDKPYLDLCIKGTQFFVQFERIMTYSRPVPNAEAAAAEYDDLDLSVPPWSWWIQFDTTTAQLYCTSNGIHGNRVEYRHLASGTSVSISLTDEECQEIVEAVDAMMERVEMAEVGRRTLSPAGTVLRYQVTSKQYDRAQEEGFVERRRRRHRAS